MTTRLTIQRLGEQGDGVAMTERGPIFVPFTLSGETVTAAVERDRATLMSVIEASPLRREPACGHFGRCGGCAIQHLDHASYLDWKRGRVVDALRRHGVDAPVADIVPCAPRTRRRVVFAARRTENRMLLGFNRALSTEIVDIEECPVTLDAIVERREDIRSVATLLCNTPRAFRIAVTATASGLDIALSGQGAVDDGARRAASAFALSSGFARLSCDGEIVVEPKKPMVAFGRIHVAPPPGGFLQATVQAEEAMAALALAHLPKAKRVADLFSGAGAFTLRLAERAEVHAVEADAAALMSLQKAVGGTTGLKRITAERRDLDRRPLTPRELERFDGVVFDPPRAGAEEQARQIARSAVPSLVAVSCNPVTLGRDLAILVAGGYVVKSVTPIDQFLWSPHVEAVALLEKPRTRR